MPEKMSDIPDITVLMQKCAQGKIKNLLDENADVMAADAQALQPCYTPFAAGMHILLAYLKPPETVQVLPAAGGDALLLLGESPLFAACGPEP